MRWLVTGAGGLLGRDLVQVLDGRAELTALDRRALDITDAEAVKAAVAGHDVVVNAAGWTDVDGAESDEAGATAVNATAVAGLADACAAAGAVLLHVSTGAVFDGTSTTPYAEDAPTSPINAYGRSKSAGERAVLGRLPDAGFVVRTSWLYGGHGPNFVATMLRLAGERETLNVVKDQWGQPTWSLPLAVRLADLGEAAAAGAPGGIYHATGTGSTSWFYWARAVFALAGLDPDRVVPIPAAQYSRPAAQSPFMVLNQTRWPLAGMGPMPHWRDMLGDAFAAGIFGGAR